MGFVLQPLNRRTWAPTGSRPQQIVSQRHDRLSVIGSLTASPNRRRVGLAFRIHVNNIRTQDMMRYLYALHRQHGGSLIVVLDRWSVTGPRLGDRLRSFFGWQGMCLQNNLG